MLAPRREDRRAERWFQQNALTKMVLRRDNKRYGRRYSRTRLPPEVVPGDDFAMPL